MKKTITVFLCYSTFVTAVLFCVGFFNFEVPYVPETVEFSYKMTNGLCAIFDFLPSIYLTGFLLACSITFGDSSVRAANRFSEEISSLLKRILLMAFVLTFFISMCTLVFLPYEKSKQAGMKNLPAVLNEYIALTQKYLTTNTYIPQQRGLWEWQKSPKYPSRISSSPESALKYIDRALKLDPQNEHFLELKREAEKAKENYESKASQERAISYTQTDLNSKKRLSTFLDESKANADMMFQEAQKNFYDRDFFAAHYLSTHAMGLYKNDPENFSKAKAMANLAWNELQAAQKEEDSPGNIFFKKKLAGYKALMDGKYVESYYIFYGLSQEDARKERDPDVLRYLELSEMQLLDNYFFYDETYDLSAFETVGNIYFSIKHPEGNYDIILIRGVTDIDGTGGLVRYLRGLQIFSFDASGNFTMATKTPYAKMQSVNVEDLDEESRKKYVLDPSIKMIPQIKLCSLGRTSSEEKYAPIYQNSKGNDISSNRLPNKIYWPMPYKDFSMIIESFYGQVNLNPFSLGTFSERAPNYGYSSEGFNFATMNKIFYPFMILILLVFIAIISWNYRLKANSIFKFKWIFVLPLFNIIFYFVSITVEYIIRILNFVFIVAAGTRLAFILGLVVYILLLATVCIVFLARKRD